MIETYVITYSWVDKAFLNSWTHMDQIEGKENADFLVTRLKSADATINSIEIQKEQDNGKAKGS